MARWHFFGASVQAEVADQHCITAFEREMGPCTPEDRDHPKADLRITVQIDDQWQDQRWLKDIQWLWSHHGHRLGRIEEDAIVFLEGIGVARLWRSQGVISVVGTEHLIEDVYVLNDVLVTPLLHSALARWGWVALHACAIEQAGVGLLIIAASGGGKSTLALALLQAGWRLVADDRVLLHTDTNVITAWGTAELPRISPGTLHFFPDLLRREHLGHTSGGKWEYDPRLLFGDCVIPWVRVQHIVFSQVKPSAISAVRPSDTMTALKEMLAAVEFGAYGDARIQAFEVISSLVAQCHVWHVDSGRDIPQIGRLFARSIMAYSTR